MDLTFGAIVAHSDSRLSYDDRVVLEAVARWRHIVDINEVVRAGDITLDELCRRLRKLPRPVVFASVARLEDHGYLPQGAIR